MEFSTTISGEQQKKFFLIKFLDWINFQFLKSIHFHALTSTSITNNHLWRSVLLRFGFPPQLFSFRHQVPPLSLSSSPFLSLYLSLLLLFSLSLSLYLCLISLSLSLSLSLSPYATKNEYRTREGSQNWQELSKCLLRLMTGLTLTLRTRKKKRLRDSR